MAAPLPWNWYVCSPSLLCYSEMCRELYYPVFSITVYVCWNKLIAFLWSGLQSMFSLLKSIHGEVSLCAVLKFLWCVQCTGWETELETFPVLRPELLQKMLATKVHAWLTQKSFPKTTLSQAIEIPTAAAVTKVMKSVSNWAQTTILSWTEISLTWTQTNWTEKVTISGSQQRYL